MTEKEETQKREKRVKKKILVHGSRSHNDNRQGGAAEEE